MTGVPFDAVEQPIISHYGGGDYRPGSAVGGGGLRGGRPFVVGGFSQGARRPLQIGLGSGDRILAVPAVAPMLLRSREVAEVIASLGPSPWPGVVLVAGSEDPAAEEAVAVAHHLQDEGVETMVEMVEGAGHSWLEPSSSALAWLAGRTGTAPADGGPAPS